MQVILILRLVILSIFTLLQGSVGILAAMILAKKDNLIMGSQFAPVCIYALLVSVIAVVWVPAMIVIDMTTQLSRWSKIKYELCWLSGLSVALIAGATATTSVLPFPKFDELSEELMWMGRWTADGMREMQIVWWTGIFVLLSHLIPLLILCLIHAESCPHLLDWPVKGFDWFPLPYSSSFFRSFASTNPSTNTTTTSPFNLESTTTSAPQLGHLRNMSSISTLPLSMSAAPPAGRTTSPSPTNGILKTNPPATLRLGLANPSPTVVGGAEQAQERALAGQSFFIQSPVTPEGPGRELTAKERREELAARVRGDDFGVQGGGVKGGGEKKGGEKKAARVVDRENRRRFYGPAGWSNDI